MSILLQGIVVNPRQSKIGQLDPEALTVHEYVLGFEVAMDDAVGVAVLKSQEQLINYGLNLLLVDHYPLQILL